MPNLTNSPDDLVKESSFRTLRETINAIKDTSVKKVIEPGRSPAVTDDSTEGYELGDIWINTETSITRVWVCRLTTEDTARWEIVYTQSQQESRNLIDVYSRGEIDTLEASLQSAIDALSSAEDGSLFINDSDFYDSANWVLGGNAAINVDMTGVNFESLNDTATYTQDLTDFIGQSVDITYSTLISNNPASVAFTETLTVEVYDGSDLILSSTPSVVGQNPVPLIDTNSVSRVLVDGNITITATKTSGQTDQDVLVALGGTGLSYSGTNYTKEQVDTLVETPQPAGYNRDPATDNKIPNPTLSTFRNPWRFNGSPTDANNTANPGKITFPTGFSNATVAVLVGGYEGKATLSFDMDISNLGSPQDQANYFRVVVSSFNGSNNTFLQEQLSYSQLANQTFSFEFDIPAGFTHANVFFERNFGANLSGDIVIDNPVLTFDETNLNSVIREGNFYPNRFDIGFSEETGSSIPVSVISLGTGVTGWAQIDPSTDEHYFRVRNTNVTDYVYGLIQQDVLRRCNIYLEIDAEIFEDGTNFQVFTDPPAQLFEFGIYIAENGSDVNFNGTEEVVPANGLTHMEDTRLKRTIHLATLSADRIAEIKTGSSSKELRFRVRVRGSGGATQAIDVDLNYRLYIEME